MTAGFFEFLLVPSGASRPALSAHHAPCARTAGLLCSMHKIHQGHLNSTQDLRTEKETLRDPIGAC